MTGAFQAIRGMNDLLPEETSVWQQMEQVLRDTVTSFGYSEIRMPLLEKTELFNRGIGEVTDVVEKEMYTFEDRSGDSLSLRPEGTAGCVRCCLEHNLLYNQEQRLWYLGPMFRHERPQKGRCRQFHQLGVEVFGLPGPDIDAEIILLAAEIWKRLGLEGKLQLQLNSLGAASERAAYRESLVKFLNSCIDELDEDSRRRISTNPLRVLDTKDQHTLEVLKDAPELFKFFGTETLKHFDTLKSLLDKEGISFELNPHLVRGLDYYNLTVFEWVSDALGAQGTVCGGGRYDGLIEQLGGNRVPAVGFGLGLERLVLLLTTLEKLHSLSGVDIYVLGAGEGLEGHLLHTAAWLRRELPGFRIMTHCGGGSFKRQFRKADRSGARFAVVQGEDELVSGMLTLKDLKDAQFGQKTGTPAEVLALLRRALVTSRATGSAARTV